MNQCPHCQTRGAMQITVAMAAQPISMTALAGSRLKVAARATAMLSCQACGWYAHGRIEGGAIDGGGRFTAGHFIAEGPPIAPAIDSPDELEA